MDARRALQRSDFFQDFSTESRDLLAGVCLPKRVAKREILFLEGEKGLACYCLVEGCVQLSKTTPDGQEVVIKTLKPGEVFGEVVLFEQARYPVTACALQPSFCFIIPRHPFSCLLRNEGFLKDFISLLMGKQRYLAERIRYLTAHDLEERLWLFLRDHFGGEAEIRTALSKKDIAAAIGATPESLSRLIARLRGEGKLHWEGQSIRLNEPFGSRDEPRRRP
jgi:CRP/FNR family transcriptional regulator